MWDSVLFSDTITRIRGVETTNGKGGTSISWDDADELDLPRASIQSKATDTTGDGRLTQHFVVYADPGIDVIADDKLIWTNARGETYTLRVIGVPQNWTLGTASHTEILAEVIDG